VQTLFSGEDKENAFIIETLGKINDHLAKKEFCYELLIRAYLYEIVFWIYQTHKYTVTEVKKEPPTLKKSRKSRNISTRIL
jgi:hypothetical protein